MKSDKLTRKERWIVAKVLGLTFGVTAAFFALAYISEFGIPRKKQKESIQTEIPFFTHSNENLITENYENGVYKRLEEVNEPRRMFMPSGDIDTIQNAYILTVGGRSGIIGIDYHKDTTIDEYSPTGTFPENHEARVRTGIKEELSKIEKELLEKRWMNKKHTN